jgi:hypothetical protein
MTRNLVIFGVLLVLALTLVLVAPHLKPSGVGATPTPTDDSSQLKVSTHTADQITQVTVQNSKQTYTLLKQSDKYVVKGQESVALDQGNAGTIFSNLAGMTAVRVIQTPSADLSQYGLNPVQATVTAQYTDGTSEIFLLGNTMPSGTNYYLMKQGDPKLYIVSNDIGDPYLKASDSLLTKEAFTLKQADVDYVKLAKNGTTQFELSTTNPDSSVGVSPWIIQQPAWLRTANDDQVSTLLTAILGVTMNDVVEGNPKDLSVYGLDKPVYDITVGSKGQTNELLIGSDEKDASLAYAKFADSNTVYSLDKTNISFTSTAAYALLGQKPAILLVNITSALGIEFEGLGQHAKLDIAQVESKDENGAVKKDSNGNPVYDQVFSTAGKTVEDKTGRGLYSTCIGLQTYSMVDPGWTAAPDAVPVASLTYTRDKDPKEIRLDFLDYPNPDFYVLRMNGQAVFLVERSKVQAIADDFGKLANGTLTPPPS